MAFETIARRISAASCLAVPLVAAAPSPGVAKNVWFEPLDNLTPENSTYVDPDYPALFTGSGSWAAGVSTFSINAVYATVATDADLQTMASFLAAHRIALNVTLPMLPVSSEPAVEGYTRTGFCWAVATRFKNLGISVASFSADEPLTWGHYYTGEDSVRYSIAATAQAFASAIGEVHEVFPNAPIIDYEAPSLTTNAQFAADLPAWLAAVKADSGHALSMLVFDADWTGDWQGAVSASQPALAQAGVKAGIFITDNDGNDVTAQAWTAGAAANEAAVEASGLSFTTKILANWTAARTVLLPQTGPYPITALLPHIEQSQGVR